MKILILFVLFVAVVAAAPNYDYPWLSDFPSESIDTMISNLNRLAEDRSTDYLRSDDYPMNSPFKKIIYRRIPQPYTKVIELPVYLHAKIKHSHINDLSTRPPISNEIHALLEALDARVNDESGHLLAYSLGGGMDNALNYAPMAICLNRGPYQRTEQEIGAFLKRERNGEVDWHLVVIYDKKLRNKQGAFSSSVNLNDYNLRPIGFCLKYSTKTRPDARSVNGASKCFYNVVHDVLDAPKN